MHLIDISRSGCKWVGFGPKKRAQTQPDFLLGWVKSQDLLPKPKPALGHFGFGLGWAGLGCMDPAIFGLSKGSGTFFGAEKTT
jgi:hypothetical protein